MMWFRREDIGTKETGVYLTRWTLFRLFGYRVYLHWFRQSDSSRCFHDHPCNVWSFVFRGTYLEYSRKHVQCLEPNEYVHKGYDEKLITVKAPTFRRFKAEHAHRIELPKGMEHKTWSLCLFFPKRRQWGFFTSGPQNWFSWTDWRSYMRDYDGSGGC